MTATRFWLCSLLSYYNKSFAGHKFETNQCHQVPISEAIEFISLLSKLQIPTETKLYKGWSHTDPILEAPMCGDHSYHGDIYELVCMWTGGNSFPYMDGKKKNDQRHETKIFDERHPMLRPICPSVLVEAARFCNPF